MSKAEYAKRQVALGERLLDDMTKQRVAQTGEAYEKAYAAVLRTPQGSAANAAMLEHWDDAHRDAVQQERPAAKRREPSAEKAAALAKADTTEDALDRLAKAAQRPGEDFAVAYDRVVRTGEGRVLYAEHCRALDEAAAAK